jgi:hypothetical protein
MWPLSLVLLFATAAPPQQDANATLYELKLQGLQLQHDLAERRRDLTFYQAAESERSGVCFTVRSYYFRRQDGQAPVLVGTATCTPASKLQQRQVKPQPGSQFVPLSLRITDQAPPE